MFSSWQLAFNHAGTGFNCLVLVSTILSTTSLTLQYVSPCHYKREREWERARERERDTDRYTIHVCMHTYAMQCQRQVDTCRHTHTQNRERSVHLDTKAAPASCKHIVPKPDREIDRDTEKGRERERERDRDKGVCVCRHRHRLILEISWGKGIV